MDIMFHCPKCGRLFKADGYHTKHRSGTVSYTVSNADSKCVCEIKLEYPNTLIRKEKEE